MNKPQRILLLGSGGREAAIAWKLHESVYSDHIFCAPGNGGTAQYATNLPVATTDFEAIKRICLEQHITILIPGSEDALVAGIYDYFQADPILKDVVVVGPSKAGAELEGSKAFAKEFMLRHGIPTASYREFSLLNYDEGLQYLTAHTLPIVLKADGLAAGKGVVIAQTHQEALEAYAAMLQDGQFGEAGSRVVVEEFLTGIELSVFAFSDGENYVILPTAKDYKRIGEGDLGLNTGGMGAISPVPFADEAYMKLIDEKIIAPTVAGLQKERIIYKGFIFFGLINVAGQPYVIEYNCRLGDPETEVVLPRLQNDLVEMMVLMGQGNLDKLTVKHHELHTATIMLVSKGYPGSYEKGKRLTGLDETKNCLLFHADTVADEEGAVHTSGGRVLAITSFGKTLSDALQNSYANAKHIDFEGKHYRGDIGYEFV